MSELRTRATQTLQPSRLLRGTRSLCPQLRVCFCPNVATGCKFLVLGFDFTFPFSLKSDFLASSIQLIPKPRWGT